MSTEFDKKRSALSLNSAYEALGEDQIRQNLSMKGWLKKKSPAVLKSWQKRYFMTIENQGGWKLVYFENDKTDSKPKGAFDLPTIQNIISKETRILLISFPGRELELKAKSAEICQKWITVLNNCRTTFVRAKRQISVDNSIKIEDESPTKALNHKQVDTMTAQLVQMKKEEEERNSGDQTKKQQKLKEKQQMEQLSNDKMLELVGLKDYIKQMNEQFIQNRMIYGYIGKRSKGKMKYFQKRWFILISAKSLYPHDYNDEKILMENQLPPWLELDSLVYFKYKDENKAPKSKGNIKMTECQEIILKNMQKSKETGFTFKLNMGDRLYHLMTETEQERKKWQTALSHSIQTTKEINNQLKIKIKKNVDIIIKMYDDETSLPARREKLKTKIQEDSLNIQNKSGINSENIYGDLTILLKFLTMLSQDMLESLQGCVVKDPQRKDIIKEYIDIIHEKISDLVTNYWDQNYKTIDSPSQLRLAQWLYDYQVQLQDFFNDDRIIQGIKVLLGIFVNRSLDNLETVIVGIVELERKCDPFLNEQEHLVTQSPIDLFKIINEGFDTAHNLCRCKETVFKMGSYGKSLIVLYQNGLEEMIDESMLKPEKLIAICNNTISLFDYTKSYAKRIQLIGGYSEEECDKVFDTQKITKQFVHISNMCREKFFMFHFGQIQKFFKKFYLDLNIVEILKQLIEPASDQISTLHDSFSRKIWKQLTETIVIFYFNCLIISCNKAKKDQQDHFLEKLEQDKELLLQELETFIFEKQLQSILKPFDDMSSFLQEESLSILEPCKNLRIYFGKAFTEKTIKQIICLRYDMDKEKKKDTLESCKELLENYNKTNKDEPSIVENQRLLDVLGMDEDDEVPKQQVQTETNRRISVTLELDDEQIEDQFIQNKQIEEETKKDFIEEGYLYKKKPNQPIAFKQLVQKWDYRYFRIRKGFMYWYLEFNSREAQNKLDLQQIDDVYPHSTDQNKFYIQLEGGKKYKFKSISKEERDLWIKSIIKEQNYIDQQQLQKIEAIKTGSGKKPLIKDYDEIARKERIKKKQEERNKKRMEKEAEQRRKQQELKQQQQQQVIELGNKQQQESQNAQSFEQQDDKPNNKQTASCWTNFLIILGIERPQ